MSPPQGDGKATHLPRSLRDPPHRNVEDNRGGEEAKVLPLIQHGVVSAEGHWGLRGGGGGDRVNSENGEFADAPPCPRCGRAGFGSCTRIRQGQECGRASGGSLRGRGHGRVNGSDPLTGPPGTVHVSRRSSVALVALYCNSRR